MGKKMREKDRHQGENDQVEEGNAVKKESDVLDLSSRNVNDVSKSSTRDDDKSKRKEDDNEKKKDRKKRRKSEFDMEEKESPKALKKHKKNKDVVGGVKEISTEAYLGEKENSAQESESSKAMYLEKNSDWEAKRVRKDNHKKKNRDGIDELATVTQTMHSKMQGPVEVEKICRTEDINMSVLGQEGEYETRKKKKKPKVSGNDHIAVMSSITDGNDTGKVNSAGNEVEKICSTEDINKSVLGQEGEYEKRKKKKKKKKKLEVSGNDHIAVMSSIADGDDTEKVNSAGNEVEKICCTEDINKSVHGQEGEYEKQKKKKNKKKKKKKKKKLEVSGNDHIAVMSSIADGHDTDKVRDDFGDAEDGNRGREKKSKSVKNDSEGRHHKGDARTRKSVNTTNQSESATPKERSKKVSFRDDVEVFPCADDIDNANKDGEEGLVYGRRYSKEEDEIIMNAVADFIESHNLGDEGLKMVLNCRDHHQARNCWKEIQAAIPWRPISSVYGRAHVLFERDEKHPWTPEEYEVVQKFVEKHGHKWRLLADVLGKHRHHVKDTWRRIKLANTKRGHWSQEEHQNLFDLVNMDLSMKVFEEKKSKHGMLRDNICWTAISDKMETRAFANCCLKWYRTLASPMVAEGIWADADDYRMLDALSSLDACCMEDVDWDNLIEHRSGDLCRKRWGQMVRHIGPHRDKSFAEQVEILANRYRPDMLEAREAYDSKIPVDLP